MLRLESKWRVVNLQCSALIEIHTHTHRYAPKENETLKIARYTVQWWNPPLKLSHMITQGNPGYTLGFDNPGYTLGFEP